MIKLNKDSNSPKMERASAPGIKVKKYKKFQKGYKVNPNLTDI